MRTIKTNKLLIIFGILGILDTITVILLHSGPNLGTFLPGLVGGLLIVYAMFRCTWLYHNVKRYMRRFERIILILFSVWLISFIFLSTVIVYSSVSDKNEKVDCVIVLGAGIRGENLSLVLKERLDLTLDYLKENKGTKIIVSGGKGIGEDITEAEAMKRYLVKNGIDEKEIVKEENSTSTIENFRYSKEVFMSDYSLNIYKVMIVTSDFHMFRAKFLAERVALEPYGISSGTPYYIYPNVFLREYFAVIKSYLMDQ